MKLLLGVLIFAFAGRVLGAGVSLASLDAQTNGPEIVIVGLNRTDPQAVHTEIQLCQCGSDHEKLKHVLLATGIFYDIRIETVESKTQITLAEKWTTIPIFKLNSGGGVQGYTFGVYDPNIFGRRIEIGTQYESLAGAPSVVVWNKLPRLLHSKFFSDIQLWRTQRTRLKYNPTTVAPVLIKALLQRSDRDYLALGYEWNSEFRSRIFLEKQKDDFSTDRIPAETLTQVSGQVIPMASAVTSFGLQFDLGQTQQIRHSPIGSLHSLQFKLSAASDKNQKDFQSIRLESLRYALYDDYLFGIRLQLGSTNTDLIQFWNYLGGFESIRGFKDNRFATRNFWLANLEGRYFLKENKNYIVQTTGFFDLIGIDEQGNKIENLHAASVGVGSRIILPKFYRVTIRFDYAQPLIKSDNQKISFGVQQFF